MAAELVEGRALSRLYISADRVEALTAEGKAAIEGERLTLSELGKVFDIKGAVHFVKVIGGDPDVHDLVGRVKDEDEIVAMGADHMEDSVIHGDVGYEVQNGFVGKLVP
jgi:hypothetical protein